MAESRDLAIEVVEDATDVFGDQAQEVASELFDEVMEADGAEARATSFDGLIDHGRTEGKVHYYAGRIEAGDRAGFEARSADLAAYYVHRSAWENLVRNCDLNHVMWARVPTGRETCGWCYTLASRGFDYHSRESAMAGKHVGCDCVVVPGNADSEVEGLDLQWMRDCWADCSDAVGGPLTREETRALWDALDDGAKARWREKHGSKAYEAFHERRSVERICAEVERRDAGWLYNGVCTSTAEANHPTVLALRERYPEAFAEWQRQVSRAGYLRVTQSQRKHVRGTAQYRGATEPPSYFTVGCDGFSDVESEEAQRACLREVERLLRKYSGSGFPRILNGKWSGYEVITLPSEIGYDARSGTGTRMITIKYGDDAFHGYPRFDTSD